MGILARVAARARWRLLVVLVLVTGLAGAVAIASVAGSSRGREALDEFIAYSRSGTMAAFVDPSLPLDEQVGVLADMMDQTGDEPFVSYSSVVVALPGPQGPTGPGTDFLVSEAIIEGPGLDEVMRSIVLEGDLPLEPGEAAINETLADRRGVGPGDTIDLVLFEPEDIDVVGGGVLPDERTEAQVAVGAIVRRPLDLAHSPQSQPGTIFEADQARMVMEPTFWAEHGRTSANYGIGAVGQVDPERQPAIIEAMTEAAGEAGLVQPSPPEDLERLESVESAIDLESNALVALAIVVAVFALVVLGSALARATGVDDEAHQTLLAIGLTRRQVQAAQLLQGIGVAVAVAAVAVAVAVPASALFPVGLAGDAEIDPGVDVDTRVLAAGFALIVVLLVARLALAAWSRRAAGSPASWRGFRLPLTGPAALGARLATDGSGAGSRATTRVALMTAVLGVAAVVGATTYAASMDHFVDSPELQGWTWDVAVGNYSEPEPVEQGRQTLQDNDDVEEFVGYNWVNIEVDDLTVALAELDAPNSLLPVVLDGRAPTGDDEVALGRGTLDELDKEIGDTVEISANRSVTARIVGEVVAPAVIATPMDLDSGGAVSTDLTSQIFGRGELSFAVAFAVDLRDDVDTDEAVDRLRADFPGTVLGPMRPLDVSTLERVRSIPYVLAGLLGTMALASVAVTLATATRRRRRDLAVLRAVGLARNQLRRLVAGESTTFVVVTLVIGVPVGVVVGRQAWALAADGVGTEVGATVPLLTIALGVLAVLVAVNLYGQWLALLAGRRKPGRDLRSE